MSSIISLMQKLGYPAEERGICVGIAYMAERARRIDQFEEFQNRMRFLLLADQEKLKQGVVNVKEKLIRLYIELGFMDEDTLLSHLDDTEKMFLSLEPFLWQISARMYPEKVQSFLDMPGSALSQRDYCNKIEPILYDENSADKILSPLTSPKEYFIRAYKNENETHSLLADFFKQIEKNNELSVGLMISSSHHTIHVFYDHQKQIWILTDHGLISQYKTINDLVAHSIAVFTKNSICNLDIEVLADGNQELKNSMLQQLANLSNESITRICNDGSINEADSNGTTALDLASINGQVDVVHELLMSDTIEADRIGNEGCNSLTNAVRANQVEVVREFFKHEKINGEERLSDSAQPLLFTAAKLGHNDVVTELLKQHIEHSVSVYSILRNPLNKAIENGHISVIKTLLNSRVSKFDALHYAVEFGNKEIVQLLLDHPKITLNNRLLDMGQFTPLHIAARAGDLEIVQMLLKNEAIDLNVGSMTHSTPLIEAINYSHFDVVCELLNHKNIDVNYCGQLCGSALNTAIDCLQVNTVTELLKNPSMNVNMVNPCGATGLAVAIEAGHVDIIKLVINHPSLDINHVCEINNKKYSHMHLLINSQLDDSIKRDLAFSLLANGFDVTKVPDTEKDLIANYLQKELPSYLTVQPFIQFINLFEKKLAGLVKNSDFINTNIIRDLIKRNANSDQPDLESIHTQMKFFLNTSAKNKLPETVLSNLVFFSSKNGNVLDEWHKALTDANDAANKLNSHNELNTGLKKN